MRQDDVPDRVVGDWLTGVRFEEVLAPHAIQQGSGGRELQGVHFIDRGGKIVIALEKRARFASGGRFHPDAGHGYSKQLGWSKPEGEFLNYSRPRETEIAPVAVCPLTPQGGEA